MFFFYCKNTIKFGILFFWYFCFWYFCLRRFFLATLVFKKKFNIIQKFTKKTQKFAAAAENNRFAASMSFCTSHRLLAIYADNTPENSIQVGMGRKSS